MKTQRKGLLLLALCSIASMGLAQPRYDFTRLQQEKLGRGVVAVRQNPNQVAVSWRYLSSDPMQTTFNLYRNGTKIASVPAGTGTFYTDTYTGTQPAEYTVKPVTGQLLPEIPIRIRPMMLLSAMWTETATTKSS